VALAHTVRMANTYDPTTCAPGRLTDAQLAEQIAAETSHVNLMDMGGPYLVRGQQAQQRLAYLCREQAHRNANAGFTTVHSLMGVGYHLDVQVHDSWAADGWRVVYAGQVDPNTPPLIAGATQAQALAAAANKVLADLADETGLNEGQLRVER